MGERPSQQSIVFTWEDFDVDGYVAVFACSIAVGKQRSLKEKKSVNGM